MYDINKLYNARVTCFEMLQDRGYTINEDDKNITFDIFQSLKASSNGLDIFANNPSNNNSIYIKFLLNKKKLNDTDLKKETNTISKDTNNGEVYTGNPNIIFVTLEKSTQNIYNSVGVGKYDNVELFVVTELCINPSKSIYTPKHEKVPKEQEKDVLELFCKNRNSLPKINHNDKQIRYLGLKRDDIVKITSKNEVCGLSVSFKLIK